jgi:hypothetical protein
VLGASFLWFLAYLEASKMGADRPQLFNDGYTYLAAAERLNAGHDLYRLQPGDRPVLTIPGVYEAPLLSPPPIAAIWRIVAAVPFGFALWMVAAWLATIAAVAYVVLRAPFPGAPLALVLSLPLGEQVFGGNACAFYPLFYLLAWRYRDHAWIGGLVAIMAAIKLAPIALGAWLLGTGRYRALGVAAMGLGVLFVFGGVGAGFDSYVEYLAMIPLVGPSPMSVSGMTGVSWASYAAFGAGIVASIVVARRSSGWSYVIAVLASVLGTPALYPGHLASLIATVAPLTDRRIAEPSSARVEPTRVGRLLATVRTR